MSLPDLPIPNTPLTDPYCVSASLGLTEGLENALLYQRGGFGIKWIQERELRLAGCKRERERGGYG